MSKRARYDGPYEEVRIAVLNQGDVYAEKFVTVKKGGLVPLETEDGESVPASVRDDLLSRDDFSEVQQADSKSTGKGDDK